MISFVTRPELTVVGLVVQAHWNDLGTVVPDAWKRVFAKADEIAAATGAVGPWLEVSISRENGFYTEMVGALVDRCKSPPDGMQVMTIPAGRYLTLAHDGPLAGIADSFSRIYDYARKHGIAATDFKLDIGYAEGLPTGRHDLFVTIDPREDI